MWLTLRTDLALRTLMYLAAQPEYRGTTDDVAACYGVSRHHLAKVVRDLSAAELITLQRGRRGGARLAREPSEIRVGFVVRLFEPGDVVDCRRASGEPCILLPGCGLVSAFDRARLAFLRELDRCTIADTAWARDVREKLTAPR